MRLRKETLLLAAIMLLLGGCAASTTSARRGGVYHTVGRGETLWRISHAYGKDVQDVAEINSIEDPSKITEGQRLFIPGAKTALKVEPFRPPSRGRVRAEEEAGRVVVEKGRFLWPIQGEIISPFGMRGEVMHYGIDIKAPRGTAVKAAARGRVVYSDNGMRGYGNVVILSHSDNYFTVYAHNERNLVKEGDNVKKGEVVALVGDSGNTAQPHLHFEIRQGKKPRNPLFFLP